MISEMSVSNTKLSVVSVFVLLSLPGKGSSLEKFTVDNQYLGESHLKLTLYFSSKTEPPRVWAISKFTIVPSGKRVPCNDERHSYFMISLFCQAAQGQNPSQYYAMKCKIPVPRGCQGLFATPGKEYEFELRNAYVGSVEETFKVPYPTSRGKQTLRSSVVQ